MKADILHDRPHNGQTTHLGGEGINLIGPYAGLNILCIFSTFI